MDNLTSAMIPGTPEWIQAQMAIRNGEVVPEEEIEDKKED